MKQHIDGENQKEKLENSIAALLEMLILTQEMVEYVRKHKNDRHTLVVGHFLAQIPGQFLQMQTWLAETIDTLEQEQIALGFKPPKKGGKA